MKPQFIVAFFLVVEVIMVVLATRSIFKDSAVTCFYVKTPVITQKVAILCFLMLLTLLTLGAAFYLIVSHEFLITLNEITGRIK